MPFTLAATQSKSLTRTLEPVTSSDFGAKRVVIRPAGGLGNQLFAYAAGLALARSHGVQLAVDDSWFSTQSKRSYELDSFRSSAVRMPGAWKPSLQDRFPRGVRQLDKLLGRRLQVKETFGESNFFFDKTVADLRVPVSLSGYFQSYKYFQDSAATLREEMTSIAEPSEWYLRELTRLQSMGDWIGIHIRRGDYLEAHNRDFHGLLSDAYYLRALDFGERLVGQLPIVIFSDDPRTDQYPIPLGRREVHVVDAPMTSRPIETVNLMAYCRAMITANSSFSWWGAWLGERPDRPVLCPRPWFNTRQLDYRDLLLPQWISVGRE